MRKIIILILFMSFFTYSHTAHAIFDVPACIESVLEYKAEIEHKILEIEKKLKDIETRARQGFEVTKNCFRNPLKCNPVELTRFLNKANEDLKGRQKVHSAWGFSIGGSMGDADNAGQEDLLNAVAVDYVYNRGQGNDLVNVSSNRKDINEVVYKEIALLFAKGASTHNDLQNESDKDLYFSKFENNNIDEILNAQGRITLVTAARLARVLEFRSSMISSAATAEMSLQNQENLETND